MIMLFGTAPTLLPAEASWQIICYSMIVGFLVSCLLLGGIMIVRASMKTRRRRDLVSVALDPHQEDLAKKAA